MAGDTIVQTKAPLVRAFNCPSCGASLKIRAVGQSIVVACENCDCIIDVQNENYQIIDRYEKRAKVQPRIPLGARGKLRGDVFEVIGFMRRADASDAYSWSEYLLFNPNKGFRWLMEAYGHWNFITTTRNKPSVVGRNAVFLSEKFKLFYEGVSKVTYVMGEFYWRVKVGSRAQVRDFISPPRVLSEEKDDDEIIWSIGEYVEPEEIRSAFNISSPLPPKSGVAPNQPSPSPGSSKRLGMYLLFFYCALFLIQMFTLAFASSKEVFSHFYQYDPSTPGQIIATEKFEQPKWRSNLEVALSSPVENNWLSVEAALVDDKTGEAYYFDEGVEYYSGIEDGESWSEGQRNTSQIISSVPAGTYFLTLEPTSGGQAAGFEVTVRRDVPLLWNCMWAFALLLIIPIIAFGRSQAFEMQRWSDSDFSPYKTE